MDARLLFLWGANHLSFPSLPCTWAVLEQAAHQAILKELQVFQFKPTGSLCMAVGSSKRVFVEQSNLSYWYTSPKKKSHR